MAKPTEPQEGYVRKRAKTRGLLLAAARRVMARKGVEAATITDIAAEADVAPGTFYNYFTTREEILEAVAAELVDEFARVMAAIERTVEDPAQRLAYSIRLFLGRVGEDPLWGWFMVRFGPSLPILRDRTREIIRGHILADGLRRKRFRLASTRAVGDLIAGTSVTALRSILEDDAPPEIAEEIAELLLRALGLPLAEARRVARLPLPELRRRNER
jgi:AcrR family transcriptional regulator